MQAGPGGVPNPATATTFYSEPGKYTFPGIDIEQGPEGNIYYAEFGSGGNGAIKRIVFTGRHLLKVSKAGTGSGTVTSAPAGIDCGSTCEVQFEEEAVTLKGTPAASSLAPTWSGCDAVNAADECVVTPTATRTVTASFAAAATPPAAPPAKTYDTPTIDKHPAKKTTERTAKFAFSGKQETRFRCKMDGKSFASCRSPRTYKNLKPGKHTFRVYAVDVAAGNRLTKNRAFSWKIVRQ